MVSGSSPTHLPADPGGPLRLLGCIVFFLPLILTTHFFPVSFFVVVSFGGNLVELKEERLEDGEVVTTYIVADREVEEF